jgi:hypothetical protein
LIKCPVRAVRALGFLKASYNDVEIYVEDMTIQNMYVFIFRKLLGDDVNFTSVTPVGDRERVLEACKLDQVIDGRKKLYVIDGDFDHLLRRPKPRLRYLYRLRAYCIENILLDEGAVVNVGVEDDTNATEQEISSRLKLDSWISELVRMLLPLFIAYAAARELQPSLQTRLIPLSQVHQYIGVAGEI